VEAIGGAQEWLNMSNILIRNTLGGSITQKIRFKEWLAKNYSGKVNPNFHGK
jgi:hypothetical protein